MADAKWSNDSEFPVSSSPASGDMLVGLFSSNNGKCTFDTIQNYVINGNVTAFLKELTINDRLALRPFYPSYGFPVFAAWPAVYGAGGGVAENNDLVLQTGGIASSSIHLVTYDGAALTRRMLIQGDGKTAITVSTSAIDDAKLLNGQINFYGNEASDNLAVKWKDSGGTVTSFDLARTNDIYNILGLSEPSVTNAYSAALVNPTLFSSTAGGAGNFADGDLILQSKGTAATSIRFATSDGATMSERMRFNSNGTALVNTYLYFGQNGSGNYQFSCGNNNANYKFAFFEEVAPGSEGHFMYGFGADNLSASTGGVGIWSGTGAALATRANAALFFDRNDLPTTGPQFMIYSDFVHGIKGSKLFKWQIAETAYNYADIANSQVAIYHDTGSSQVKIRGKTASGTQFDYLLGGTAGTGDVVGPASSIAGALTFFADTTGKLIAAATNATYDNATNTLKLASASNANVNLGLQADAANGWSTIDAYRDNAGSPVPAPIRLGYNGGSGGAGGRSNTTIWLDPDTIANVGTKLFASSLGFAIDEVLNVVQLIVKYADGTTLKSANISVS